MMNFEEDRSQGSRKKSVITIGSIPSREKGRNLRIAAATGAL
jgi:hypothetical protein